MKPVLLVIRDGWGENHNPKHDKFNAVKLANIPVSRGLTKDWPRTEIMAHGLDVGLPVGIMGNSEVGHQNIGAGRIVDQEIVRIDKGLTDPAAMRQIKAFRGLVENVKSGRVSTEHKRYTAAAVVEMWYFCINWCSAPLFIATLHL